MEAPNGPGLLASLPLLLHAALHGQTQTQEAINKESSPCKEGSVGQLSQQV